MKTLLPRRMCVWAPQWAKRVGIHRLLPAATSNVTSPPQYIHSLPFLAALNTDLNTQEIPLNKQTRKHSSSSRLHTWKDVQRSVHNTTNTQSGMYMLPVNMMNGASQDLKRFLEQVGTNPKEARYWLKHYKKNSESSKPFAVVQVNDDVFRNPDMLDSLSACLSFLHRSHMKPVVIHGQRLRLEGALSTHKLQSIRSQLSEDSMLLVNLLESHGAPARLLYSNILTATRGDSKLGDIECANMDPIKWCLHSGHIPVINSIGETADGQLLALDVTEVTEILARCLEPTKVLILNTTGGYLDDDGQVVANINLPAFMETEHRPKWCNTHKVKKIERINRMLKDLPCYSSVVITSASTLLHELFTHHGSGTFFKIAEPVHKYTSLEGIDRERLRSLMNWSFSKTLKEDYFNYLEKQLHTIYLSEGYSAAAILTKHNGVLVPYLDKFAVTQKLQGQGLSDMLWEMIKKDFPQLFWRSRSTNTINSWYFKKCDGSWSDGDWIVFWYGVTDHRQSAGLIDFALDHASSFVAATEDYEYNSYPSSGFRQKQSPIDIRPDSNVSKEMRLVPLSVDYSANNDKTLVNTGKLVMVNVKGDSCEIRGGPLEHSYRLEQFHWHWGSVNSRGSEHTINGQCYAAELHLVHWNSDLYESFNEAASQEDGLAVLAVLLKVGRRHSTMSEITDLLPQVEYRNQSCDISCDFDQTTLLPECTSRYFTYKGSLTTPPWYESVTWVVFEQLVEVAEDQIAEFRKLKSFGSGCGCKLKRTANGPVMNSDGYIVDNYRTPQPMGDRIIFASF